MSQDFSILSVDYHILCHIGFHMFLIIFTVKDICHACKLDAVDLVCEWMAFSQKLANQDPTIDILEEFERKVKYYSTILI